MGCTSHNLVRYHTMRREFIVLSFVFAAACSAAPRPVLNNRWRGFLLETVALNASPPPPLTYKSQPPYRDRRIERCKLVDTYGEKTFRIMRHLDPMSIPVNPGPDESRYYYIMCDNEMYRMWCGPTEMLYVMASDVSGEKKLFVNMIHSYSQFESAVDSSDGDYGIVSRVRNRPRTIRQPLPTPGHTLYGVFHNDAAGSSLTQVSSGTVHLRAWCGGVK